MNVCRVLERFRDGDDVKEIWYVTRRQHVSVNEFAAGARSATIYLWE